MQMVTEILFSIFIRAVQQRCVNMVHFPHLNLNGQVIITFDRPHLQGENQQGQRLSRQPTTEKYLGAVFCMQQAAKHQRRRHAAEPKREHFSHAAMEATNNDGDAKALETSQS